MYCHTNVLVLIHKHMTMIIITFDAPILLLLLLYLLQIIDPVQTTGFEI